MNTGLDVIKEYYARIDRSDVEWVVALFASDAVYQRASVSYNGQPEIRKFFSDDLSIRGRHDVASLWFDEKANAVFVTGRFERHGESDDARSVGFADIWTLDERGLIAKLQTHLAESYAHVER